MDADQKPNEYNMPDKSKKGIKRLVIALVFIAVLANLCLGLHFIITNYRENLAEKEPLCFAVMNENLEEVERLISEGADVNVKVFGGRTPLMIAAGNHNSVIAEKLLLAGANPNQQDNFGSAPLHFAINSADVNLELISILVKHGANINTKDIVGRTPLHLAAQYGQLQVVQLLLKHGADPNIQDYGGETAADSALFHPKVRSVLKQAEK